MSFRTGKRVWEGVEGQAKDWRAFSGLTGFRPPIPRNPLQSSKLPDFRRRRVLARSRSSRTAMLASECPFRSSDARNQASFAPACQRREHSLATFFWSGVPSPARSTAETVSGKRVGKGLERKRCQENNVLRIAFEHTPDEWKKVVAISFDLWEFRGNPST